ncbi:MAG: hypothetical protein ACLTKG_01890 [Collinsella intestinalis]
MFPRWTSRSSISATTEFALDLLHQKGILITRGGGFNWPEPDHFRIVYLPPMDVLHEAMEDLGNSSRRTPALGRRKSPWSPSASSGALLGRCLRGIRQTSLGVQP